MEKTQLLLEKLQEIHLNCGIIGVANKDQKEISGGFANFNYVSENEMVYASKIFSKMGIENFPRQGKKCNLTFPLEEKIIKIKRNYHRSIPGSKAIESVLWILRKIHKKKILTVPIANGVKGLSKRGIVECSKKNLLEIQKQLINRFGIYITVEDSNDSRRVSEFFVVTNPKTKKLCEGRELILVKEILKKKEEDKMNHNYNETMNLKIRNLLVASGYKKHSKEIPEDEQSIIHFQFRNVKPGTIKVVLLLGDREEKKNAADHVRQILVNNGGFVVEKHNTWLLVTRADETTSSQATQKDSTFLGSLSDEQKNLLLSELGVDVININSVVDAIAEKFFFIEKSNSVTSFINKEVFSSPDDVKKIIGK